LEGFGLDLCDLEWRELVTGVNAVMNLRFP